jgi:ELWxxDGT repeat protein
VKLSIRQPARLAWLVLLLAGRAMLLSASGVQAASKRGAVLVKDIRPGGSSSITEPDCGCGETSYAGGDLTNVHWTLYFSADDGRHGYELWRSDGTRKGTRMVRNIRRGTAGSEPENLTAVGKTLFFTASERRHGNELWRAGPTVKAAIKKCQKRFRHNKKKRTRCIRSAKGIG